MLNSYLLTSSKRINSNLTGLLEKNNIKEEVVLLLTAKKVKGRNLKMTVSSRIWLTTLTLTALTR